MANNADLIIAAQALGEKLGETVDVQGLKNKELVALVSELRGRADNADRASSAESTTATLVAQVRGLADELHTIIETDGLTDEALTELVENLKVSVNEAAKADADADAVDVVVAQKEEADALVAQKEEVIVVEMETEKPPFYIMAGKALTSKRGILGPGDEIKPEDIAGGENALNAFVNSGHVGKG